MPPTLFSCSMDEMKNLSGDYENVSWINEFIAKYDIR